LPQQSNVFNSNKTLHYLSEYKHSKANIHLDEIFLLNHSFLILLCLQLKNNNQKKTTKMNTKSKIITLSLGIALVFSGCNASKTLKGGAIGSGAGAVIGGVIGSRSDNTATGAIVGAAVG